ncbi:hypothetical protein [Jannaschia sp. R86511]|uniref:hypothetical protein n=1 Tax=Jannaschia sp. R86511 TaxID=3093853 RepID=UPI0036D2E205
MGSDELVPPPKARVDPSDSARSARYEFLVPGEVSEAVLAAFPGMRCTPGSVGGTVLYGPVEDAGELSGVLDRLAAMGIPVAEIRRLPD